MAKRIKKKELKSNAKLLNDKQLIDSLPKLYGRNELQANFGLEDPLFGNKTVKDQEPILKNEKKQAKEWEVTEIALRSNSLHNQSTREEISKNSFLTRPSKKEEKHLNNKLAQKKAEQLAIEYNVNVAVISDADFFSDEYMIKSIEEKRFFISNESPLLSAKITEYAIRREQIKNNSKVQLANIARVNKAVETSEKLYETIRDIEMNHMEITGEKPSLYKVAKILTERNVQTPSGKNKWYVETVKRIYNNKS